MRRAISAFVAFLLALWAAFVVRFTNGIPVLWSLLFVLCPVVCVSDEPSPYPEAGIVRVMGKASIGHGCPVEPTRLLTAKHVVEAGWFQSDVVWSDLAGNEGRATPVRSDASRDMSVLNVTAGRLGVTFALAKNAPAIGERVYIVGYSFNNQNFLKVNAVDAKVIGLTAGHLLYSKSPGGGSSGSCVLNAQREVVAVNVGMIEATGTGIGVAVWGVWAPQLEEKVEATQTAVAKDPDEGS